MPCLYPCRKHKCGAYGTQWVIAYSLHATEPHLVRGFI